MYITAMYVHLQNTIDVMYITAMYVHENNTIDMYVHSYGQYMYSMYIYRIQKTCMYIKDMYVHLQNTIAREFRITRGL